MIDINNFWDRKLHPNNTTQALMLALEVPNKPTIYFPAGQYWLQDVILHSETHLVCDQNAEIRGVTSEDTLLKCEGGIFRIKIQGGIWRNCATVFEHIGSSALSDCHFSDMRLTNIAAGFRIDGSVGNRWNNCKFQNGVTDGIVYTGAMQSNANAINQCKFMNCNGIPITLNRGANNVVRDTWIENNASGVKINEAHSTLVEGCYFESNTGLDVEMIGGGRQTHINYCHFATSDEAQSYRISSLGNTHFYARGNNIFLKDGQVFALVGGVSVFMSFLVENYLNAIGGGDYADRLFLRQSNQTIKYDIGLGSGFVDGDLVYSEYII